MPFGLARVVQDGVSTTEVAELADSFLMATGSPPLLELDWCMIFV
jgi:hypothetical protein